MGDRLSTSNRGRWCRSQEEAGHQLAGELCPPLSELGGHYHGQNNWQENFVRPSQSWEAAFVAGHGRRKRQTQAALDFVGPAPGSTAANFAQSALNFVAPAPGPSPVNFAQSSLDFVGPAPSNYVQAQLNFQQEALNFIARG